MYERKNGVLFLVTSHMPYSTRLHIDPCGQQIINWIIELSITVLGVRFFIA